MASLFRSITSRARWLILGAILGELVLIAAGLAIQSPGALDPVDAYDAGGGFPSVSTIPLVSGTVLLVVTVVAVAAYLNERKFDGDRTSVVWGNWWLLITIPAILGNSFDEFVGHYIFILLSIAMAFLFWLGKGTAWKWGAAIGVFFSSFYVQDGVGDLIRGGVWNQSGVTLSSVAVTHTLWGLLAFVSDLMVAMLLIPLTYNMFMARKAALTAILFASVVFHFPSLLLLPTLGFNQVFYGWPSTVSNIASAIALAAVPLVWRAKPGRRQEGKAGPL